MPKYQYTALNLENKKVKDIAEAKDDADLRAVLRRMNLVPVKFKEIDEAKVNYRLKSDEIADFCRQLTAMFSSGITAARAMEILKDSDFKPKLKAVYEKLHASLLQGISISESMRLLTVSFPELLINMIASGEASGQLEKVTGNMAVHYDKEHRLNGKVKTATRYPKIIGVVTIFVVVGIFIFILPQFFDVLLSFGGELPLITRAIMGITDFFMNYYLFIIIGLLLIILGVKYLLTIDKARLAFDKLKLRLPVIGKPLRTIYTARFSRTIASLYASGVPMLRSLEIAGTVLSNKYIESQFPEITRSVRNGELLSAAIAKIDGFDPKLASIIVIGEESGRLDAMLSSAAEMFDYEAEMALAAIVALSEPLMLVVLGGVILVVILGVMLPMMSLYSSIT
ncbi:MAG: type II secretion system F family protein [Oscillospiraceae bacterium]|nr:type II secretion system F family protein [Oscillospiraceae bacterium]